MHLSAELALLAQWYERNLTGDITITPPASYVLAGQFRAYAARAAELEELSRTLAQMEAIAQDIDPLAAPHGTAHQRCRCTVVPVDGADNVVAFPGTAHPRGGAA